MIPKVPFSSVKLDRAKRVVVTTYSIFFMFNSSKDIFFIYIFECCYFPWLILIFLFRFRPANFNFPTYFHNQQYSYIFGTKKVILIKIRNILKVSYPLFQSWERWFLLIFGNLNEYHLSSIPVQFLKLIER